MKLDFFNYLDFFNNNFLKFLCLGIFVGTILMSFIRGFFYDGGIGGLASLYCLFVVSSTIVFFYKVELKNLNDWVCFALYLIIPFLCGYLLRISISFILEKRYRRKKKVK